MVVGLALASGAVAEPGGLFAGRSGDPSLLPDTSIEAGYIKQDEGNTIGARFNYRIDERTMVYGDFGRLEFEDEDSVPPNTSDLETVEASGQGFGLGVFYHVPELVETLDVSLQASYHRANLDGSGFVATSEIDQNGQFSVDELEDLESSVIYAGLFGSSREPLSENGLFWYLTLGFARVDAEFTLRGAGTADDDSTDPVYGGGLVLPLASGQAYAGYEVLDGEAEYGVGFRYFFE